MSDIVDMASKTESIHLQAKISSIQNQQSKVTFVGWCLNCHEKLEKPKLFCDLDCSSDYEKLKANGKL